MQSQDASKIWALSDNALPLLFQISMALSRFPLLHAAYQTIEQQFEVEAGPELLRNAVNFRANNGEPIHRWFSFKEGFSAELFSIARIDTDCMTSSDGIFVDPFCGSGTSILSAELQQNWSGLAVGIEINPFLAFVAKTKLDWALYDSKRLLKFSDEVLSEPLRIDLDTSEWPQLSTLHNANMFAAERVSALVDAVRRVGEIESPYCNVLLLGIAAAAETLSNYRKTGRALRVLRSETETARRSTLTVEGQIREKWSSYSQDLDSLEGKRNLSQGHRRILQGDGRKLHGLDLANINYGDVNLMVYSPPYLNQIDYTEVYKVELWLLQFIKDNQAMQNLRRSTVRSHASIQTAPLDPQWSTEGRAAYEICSEMVTQAGDAWHRQFPRLAANYFADMQLALTNQFKYLTPGGRAICIVANSAHGPKGSRVPIAVDLLLANSAEEIGFQVEKFQVARSLPQRDHLNQYVRESVLWFRKPSSS